MSFSASSAAWLAMLGVAASSLGSPRVLVWPEDEAPSPRDAQTIESAGFEPVEYATHTAAVEAARADIREETRTALEAVRVQLDQAQAHYLEQDFARMEQVLADAEAQALVLLALPDTCDTLWELQFRRGLAARGANDLDDAVARFRLAASLRPQRRPDASYYGPDVAQAFAEAVELERASVNSPFGVAVTPTDATRFVDCAPAPAESKLSLGLHVVWAVAPGREPQAEVVDVSQTSTVRLRLPSSAAVGAAALATLPSAIPIRWSDPSARAVVEQVLDERDAQALVWLRRDGERWDAQLHVESGQGKVHRDATREGAIAAAIAELGPDGRLVIVAPVVEPSPDPDAAPATKPRSIARKWWFWTIVGGVVVASVAVGLGIGLRPEAAGPSRQTITVE